MTFWRSRRAWKPGSKGIRRSLPRSSRQLAPKRNLFRPQWQRFPPTRSRPGFPSAASMRDSAWRLQASLQPPWPAGVPLPAWALADQPELPGEVPAAQCWCTSGCAPRIEQTRCSLADAGEPGAVRRGRTSVPSHSSRARSSTVIWWAPAAGRWLCAVHESRMSGPGRGYGTPAGDDRLHDPAGG